MKLEVGMFVRTKYNGIGKIVEYINDPTHYFFKCYKLDRDCSNCEEYITEADVIEEPSHNIMDLIEVGDVIEVKEFKGKYEVRQFGLELSIVKEDTIYNLNSLLCTLNIKTIVTKEQFEQMQYKVGE